MFEKVLSGAKSHHFSPKGSLLVAARMYEFRRTIKEIVSIVKVCESTLRKRLVEFEDTPTSQLTIEEFMKIDLDQECDPPCFTAGLQKKRFQQVRTRVSTHVELNQGRAFTTRLRSNRRSLKGWTCVLSGTELSPSPQESNQSLSVLYLRALLSTTHNPGVMTSFHSVMFNSVAFHPVLEIELKKKMDDVEDEIHEYQDEIDAELQSSRPKLRGVYAAYAREDCVGDEDNEDALCTTSKVANEEEPEEEEELQAVAKHFGKDLGELTLEALIKLEQSRPEDEEENQDEEEDGVPKRKCPSLASILGTMPTAATLGLSESITKCIGDEKENDEAAMMAPCRTVHRGTKASAVKRLILLTTSDGGLPEMSQSSPPSSQSQSQSEVTDGAADTGELDLSGIDDSEIELYLLDDKEIKIKTALWMAENSDYLKEQKEAEKEAKIAKEKALGIYKEKKVTAGGLRSSEIRRRRRRRRGGNRK
ncbi:hypothetical protein INR49_018808 [Caranx melampygus]|nr:hypothetical protein INR49_018808 [Caranx melampygus]